MCRAIRTLHNFTPPVTDEEVHAAATQFVRKVSGFTRPSQANAATFAAAIDEVASATRKLMEGLVTAAPPKTREAEADRLRERWQKRARAQARTSKGS
jgi:hypothetical protein